MRKPIGLTALTLPLVIVLTRTTGAHLLDTEEQNIIRTGDYNECGEEILLSEPKPWERAEDDGTGSNRTC